MDDSRPIADVLAVVAIVAGLIRIGLSLGTMRRAAALHVHASGRSGPWSIAMPVGDPFGLPVPNAGMA